MKIFNPFFRFQYAVLFIFSITSNSIVFSQAPPPYQREFTPQSPEASAFNKYGDIGVSQFTGSPNISFPLNISTDVPLSISYNASGVKPEEHHGWLGSNWNLNVGGMISRIKRGEIDEIKFAAGTDISYLNNTTLLNGTEAGWDDLALASKSKQFPSGSEEGLRATADLEPDEFVFSFGQYSGSFLKNHENKWVFRGNNPSEFQLKNENVHIVNDVVLGINITDNVAIDYRRMIMGFTIQTSDGTEYTFGGDQSAVDISFSLDGITSQTEVQNKVQDKASATAWHLTKIKYINGQEIDFAYEKDAFCMVVNQSRRSGLTVSNGQISDHNTAPSKLNSFTRNSYLKKITTPYEIVEFSREVLTGVSDYLSDSPVEFSNLQSNINLNTGIDIAERKWFKLTRIKTFKKPILSSSQKPLWDYSFEYQNSPSNRLQLLNIKQHNAENSAESITLYKFSYQNSTGLSSYVTSQIDHWGYFNGNTGLGGQGIITDESTMQSLRTPSVIMQTEILDKIQYPTDGYTQFIFEPHDYFAYCDNTPLANNSNGALSYTEPATFISNTRAGGLRVRTIKNYDGQILREKSFLYVKQYTNANAESAVVSSGVLGNVPFYFDAISGTQTIKTDVSESGTTAPVNTHSFLNEQSVNPLNLTSGSPVTYSEVVEKNQDGSYIIYKFTNFDDPLYRNRQALDVATRSGTTIVNPKKDPVIDYEHLRGRLLETRMYTQDDKIVKQVKNTYSNTLNKNEAVRAVYIATAKISVKTSPPLDGTQSATERRAVSYYIHTSPVYLLTTETTDYFYNPTAQVAVVTTNTYDDRKNLTKQEIKHLNNNDVKSNSTTDYSYAYNGADAATNVVKLAMKAKHMIGIPLETKNNFNKGIKVEFAAVGINGKLEPPASPYNKPLLPNIYYSQNQAGGFTEQFRIIGYTNYDKPTQTQSKGTNTTAAITTTEYNWNQGLLTNKIYGGLTWEFKYDFDKRLLIQKKDENGLLMKFQYDGYRRLTTMQDRYTGTVNGTTGIIDVPQNVQATKTFTYQYKDNNNPYNFVGTSITYANASSLIRPLSTKQYSDGLGRPIGGIKEFYTPDQLHQKAQITYDALGRQDRTTQVFKSSVLGYQAAPTATPYVQTIYEVSPLSRPIRQIMEDGRTVETMYAANTKTVGATNPSSDLTKDDVRMFNTSTTRIGDTALLTVTTNGLYTENTLYKTIVWDENGTQSAISISNYIGRIDVFKDKLGRVILTRKFVKDVANPSVFLRVDTYNVYDTYGNLVMVIPPDAISLSNTIIYNLTFQYLYDIQNRLIEKKVPGAKSQKFWYNDRDQLVLTQDGNMRAANKHLATVYDNIGRVERTGFISNFSPTLTVNGDFTTDITDLNSDRLTSTQYYAGTNWVKHQEHKVLKPSDVSTIRNYVWSYIERRAGLTYLGNPIWSGKQHLLCGKTYFDWNTYTLVTAPDGPIGDDDTDGVDWRVSDWNGAQIPNLTKRYTFSSNYAQQVRTVDYNTYDHSLRQVNLGHAFASGGASTGTPITLSNTLYNYKDQLIEKNIGYNSTYAKYLQSIDYTYNTRGWLKGINEFGITGNTGSQMQILTPQSTGSGTTIQNLAISPFINQAVNDMVAPYRGSDASAMTAIDDDNLDLYNQTINYDTPDSRFGSPTPQYNGNISNTFWKVAGRAEQGYGFKYDELNRLKEANYYDVTTGITTSPIFQGGKFDEKVLEYDLRGNIKKLYRTGFKEAVMNTNNDITGNYGEIDNLIYGYDPIDLNRIRKITDGTSSFNTTKGFKYANSTLTTDYTYDDNGNLTSDKNKGIVSIEYNYLNLPQKITFATNPANNRYNQIIFVYDASGYKHRKITRTYQNGLFRNETLTDYVSGCEYVTSSPNLAEYANPANSVIQRLQHAEGSLTQEAGSTTFGYEYVLRDHLSNTRVTFKDKNNDGAIDFSNIDPSVNEISQINHYYPFGLNMEGNWNGAAGANKYQFNGIELNSDFGLDLNMAFYRGFDPAVGRWWQIDPKPNFEESVYSGMGNNPISFSDFLGDTIVPGAGFFSNTWNGVKDGASGTWDFVKSLSTVEGWKNLGTGIVATGDLFNSSSITGALKRDELINSTINGLKEIPNLNRDQIGYGLGYGAEKITETILLSKGVGLLKNGISTAELIGTAQSTGTRGHAFISKLIAYRYYFDPRVERITLNLGYKKLLGANANRLSLRYGPRPDVGVLFKSGDIRVFEVMSKTDDLNILLNRNNNFMLGNGINGTTTVLPYAKWINTIFPK